MATAKQQAPPPPTGFTGEVPRPRLGQVAGDKWRARRARKAGQPKRPIIQIVHGGRSSGRRPVGPRSRPRARRYSRRRPRRGTLFACLSVVVATCALTATIIEFSMWEAAAEIGTAAEFVSFGTAWFFGDPSPRPDKAPKTPPKPRAAGNPPPKSGGHRCGSPTEDGSPCNNPVSAAGEKCWRHPGGSSGPKTKMAPKPRADGPKKTKKAAPPPVPTP